MNWTLSGSLIICGSIFLLALAWLAVRLLRYRNVEVPRATEDDGGDFIAARYEPMARLVQADDLAFLSSLPGYRAEIGTRLRRQRNRIFRMYLRDLAGDFHRLHASARQLVTESPESHAGLVGLLMRQELRFLGRLALIEIHLLMPRADLPQIDVAGLLASVDSMRLDLTRITAHS